MQETKPDIVVTHIENRNRTYKVDIDTALVAENIMQIGKRCVNFGAQRVLTSFMFTKKIKPSFIIKKINDELSVLCLLQNFHFVLNEKITRNCL